MKYGLLVRLFSCIFVFGVLLYAYINEQNSITRLRLQIPQLTQQLNVIEQDNIRLQFEIDQFESPTHLMELAKRPEYRHLRHPLQTQVIEVAK